MFFTFGLWVLYLTISSWNNLKCMYNAHSQPPPHNLMIKCCHLFLYLSLWFQSNWYPVVILHVMRASESERDALCMFINISNWTQNIMFPGFSTTLIWASCNRVHTYIPQRIFFNSPSSILRRSKFVVHYARSIQFSLFCVFEIFFQIIDCLDLCRWYLNVIAC